MVDHAGREQAAQIAVGHLVQAGLGDLPAGHGGLQGRVEEHLLVELLAALLVEAGLGGGATPCTAPQSDITQPG